MPVGTTAPLATLLTDTRWTLDPDESRVAFSVTRPLGPTVHGRMQPLGGELVIGGIGRGRAELRIDASSVQTGNRLRDRHLRSPRYFGGDRHPVVRVIAAVLVGDGPGTLSLGLSGELQAAGRAVPIGLTAEVSGDADALTVTAQAMIDARALGMSWSPIGALRTPTRLSATARVRRSG